MMLNATQIQLIDRALTKIGICYIDIRLELTDHIAAALEQKDDRFEHHLKGYILEHKSALKKLNRKFIFITACKAYRQLLTNFLRPVVLAIVAAVFVAGYVLNAFFDKATTTLIFFLIFTCICCLISGPAFVDTIFSKKKQYSFGFGFSALYLLLLYPTIYMLGYQQRISNLAVLLYFTIVITVSSNICLTIKQFDKYYKLRYNA